MGHRALVAYRRPDRLYGLRYSHWGGEDLALAEAITPRTPLADGAIDGALLADSISRDRILTDHLDPRVHEALYLVDPDAGYAVDPYRVCWLEWGDGRDGGRGAIVATEPADDRAVRVWFRATKTALADVIEMGVLSRRAAQTYLEARVHEEWAGRCYTYGDAPADEPAGGYDPPLDRWLGGADGPEEADGNRGADGVRTGENERDEGNRWDGKGNGREDEGSGDGD
ncbi:hypothetical protein C488_00989 [Natrinema pellirubrum DSM 15624]|uniref:Uncharacterized protein n=1 Tax=Natrinema pellirubrum (strain DSM 15624 / CIP 106293 / JCM 10476 / NCIMB 786 / 157) TaxID=797303 RepID=L0JKD9_NATP1|nr:DUF6735 family protein [Natrinema pellirubrum]AGB31293.1 hypothetical protein Natpe_1389 [Natrinema pellirubrum DSM 15624]ELY81769.1 hypothetical protein C488_00989 [Natrinema pellirubrum DSM 15624]